MKKDSLIMKILVCTLGFLFIVPGKTHAYLDPGSGSYMFQLAIGVFLGLAYTFRIYGKRIVMFIKSLLKRTKKMDNR